MIDDNIKNILTKFYNYYSKQYNNFNFELLKIKQMIYFKSDEKMFKLFCDYEEKMKEQINNILTQFYKFLNNDEK